MKRTDEDQLTPAWWVNFHFRLHSVLESKCNCVGCQNRRRIFGEDHYQRTARSFIYGAVFEYAPPDDAKKNRHRHPSSAPRYVVAFRGTMPRNATVFGDMRLNFRVLRHRHRFCGRFTGARTHVASLLASTPPAAAGGGGVRAGGTNSGAVWLAGHSLGASIALDVGRDDMVAGGRRNLPTFLFNPPHVSVAPLIDAVMPEEAKRGLYRFSYVVKSALGTTILRSHRRQMEQFFMRLSPWVPNLYVHREDTICKGFIDYFQQREQVREWSAGVARLADTLSYREMAYSLFNQQRQSQRQHLLPCAVLWTSSHDDDPHELQQWWRPTGAELDLTRDEYIWPLIIDE